MHLTFGAWLLGKLYIKYIKGYMTKHTHPHTWWSQYSITTLKKLIIPTFHLNRTRKKLGLFLKSILLLLHSTISKLPMFYSALIQLTRVPWRMRIWIKYILSSKILHISKESTTMWKPDHWDIKCLRRRANLWFRELLN